MDKQSSCSAKQTSLDKQMAKQSCLDKQMGLDDQMFGKTDDLFICCPERYSFFKRILEYYVDPHPLSFLLTKLAVVMLKFGHSEKATKN